jgi:AcrR family transcriptional regulator
MSQARREEQHAAIHLEIKNAARKLMVQDGTAGLSMRAISREMDLTAPALYHYYAGRDAVITDLILDAFNALGKTVETTRDDTTQAPLDRQMEAILLAYRGWALEHPINFQLIYGNPIPGYEAPGETTVPAAERSFRVFIELIATALEKGQASCPEPYRRVPSELRDHIRKVTLLYGNPGQPTLILAYYLAVIGWTRIHGIIMLELFNHIQPVVGNAEAFYIEQIHAIIKDFGLGG